jgi:HNH endonuclease
MPVRYTRELLDEAARETTNFDDAVRWCGGNPTPGSRRYIRAKMSGGKHRHVALHPRPSASHRGDIARTGRLFQERGRGRTSTGINPVGGNQAHIGRRIAALRIDTSHFLRAPRGRPRGSLGNRLVLGSPADGRIPAERLRRELLRTGIQESCAICGTGTEWNGKPLRLEVDHRNGDWWDNRPQNLRLLCPNCHAVTDTYRGRNRRHAA